MSLSDCRVLGDAEYGDELSTIFNDNCDEVDEEQEHIADCLTTLSND